MFSIEVLKSASNEILGKILLLEKKIFPPSWQFESEYFREKLSNPENINIIVWRGLDIVGYALLVPHNQAYSELKDDDPLMTERDGFYYFEGLDVDPDEKGKGLFRLIMGVVTEETRKKGAIGLSMHVRVENGLSNIFSKYFHGKILEKRRVRNWVGFGGEESADYTVFGY
ncbi:MAG: GNAT family N-acetyltransferase [Candidatus Moraniibacteriota bacterium]